MAIWSKYHYVFKNSVYLPAFATNQVWLWIAEAQPQHWHISIKWWVSQLKVTLLYSSPCGKIMRMKIKICPFPVAYVPESPYHFCVQNGYEILTIVKRQNQRSIQHVPVSCPVPPPKNCHFLNFTGGWMWRLYIRQMREILAHRMNCGPRSSGLPIMPRTVQRQVI